MEDEEDEEDDSDQNSNEDVRTGEAETNHYQPQTYASTRSTRKERRANASSGRRRHPNTGKYFQLSYINPLEAVHRANHGELQEKVWHRQRPNVFISIEPSNEDFDHVEVIDLSTILCADSIGTKNPFARIGKHGNGDGTDLHTGFLGEQMVYEYLRRCNSQSGGTSIKWENEKGESQLPYDILLVKDEIKHFIEVKSTRTSNQHSFLLSLNQIEAMLRLEQAFFIYRVYTEQKKLVILDRIRWRLKHKQQLACFLTIQPLIPT